MGWFGRKEKTAAAEGAAAGDGEAGPLVLWGRASSINVQKPAWLLAELGLDFHRVDAGGPFGRLDTPEYRAMNPQGLVPTLVDRRGGGEPFVMFESNAICRYLAAKEQAESIWPSDPAARARVDQWMEWAQLGFTAAFLPLFMVIIRTAAAERDQNAMKATHAKLGQMASIAEAQLAQSDYLAGPDFTLADVIFGAALYRYSTLEITRPDTPALDAYHQRIKARAAYAPAVEVPYEGMRVPGAERPETPVI